MISQIPHDIKEYINKAIGLIAQYETSQKTIVSSYQYISDIKSKLVTINKLWSEINYVPNDSEFRNAINNFITLMDNVQKNKF